MSRLTNHLVGFLCVWSVAVVAYAQEKQDQSDTMATLVDAIQEYRAGNYPEARALFQRAHELQPSARTLRGLGLVEYTLNHRVEAIRFLQAAINDARDALTPELKLEAERLIQEMRVYVGYYRVNMSPAGATLTVDGSPADISDQLLLLELGEHLLSVRALGHQPQERRLSVRGGETEDLRFDLVQETPAVAPVIATTPPVPEAPPAAKPRVPLVAAREERSPLARRTTWGWVALGASALSLTGTVIAWRVGESAADRWNDDDRCLRDGNTRAENCGADEDTAKAARTWATVGLVATGVFGATAVLLLWPGQKQPERSGARAQCVVASLGLACALRL